MQPVQNHLLKSLIYIILARPNHQSKSIQPDQIIDLNQSSQCKSLLKINPARPNHQIKSNQSSTEINPAMPNHPQIINPAQPNHQSKLF